MAEETTKTIEKNIKLNPQVWNVQLNPDLVAQVLYVYMNNERKGTAKAKTRGEVSGGGRKPWRQKGTGRARQGSIRSPLWRKGGVVFGPTDKRNWKRDINEKKIGHHLIPITTERELTFYENIFRLPAATKIIINFQKQSKSLYWILNSDLEIKFDNNEEYYQKFFELFQIAVECRLRTQYKVGFELSGGIDSSSVVLMAKKIFSKDKKLVNTFSIIFEEIKESDESYYINKVVETGGIKPHYLIGDSISPFSDIDKILFFNEEPSQTPNISMIWQLFRKMNDNNIRVVLGGHDGDCLLYKGEKYLMELFFTLRWKKLIQELKFTSKIHQSNLFKLFISKVIFQSCEKCENIWLKFKRERKEKDFLNLNKEFVKKLNLKREFKIYFLDPFRDANNSKKMHYYYLSSGTHQMIFEMMDRLAGYFNIEPRHPMMDKRLLEFCHAIPTEFKYNKGWGRLLTRIGLSELLPQEIKCRIGKTNFFPVFNRNLLLYEKISLDKLIYKNKFTKKYSNCENLTKIYQRYKKGKKGADSIDIWKIAILSLWLNKLNKIIP